MRFGQRTAIQRLERGAGRKRNLAYDITVLPGPDGRPGAKLRATSKNLRTNPVLGPDGSREDLHILLNRRKARLISVCLGPVTERRAPMDSARYSIERGNSGRTFVCLEEPRWTTIGATPAVTYLLLLKKGKYLKEFKFESEGWLFSAGVLYDPGDRTAVKIGREILDTWSWLPGTLTGAARYPPPSEVHTVTAEVVVRRTPTDVWSLLRPPEFTHLLASDVLDAYRVPGTPDGVGEQHAVVIAHGTHRHTRITEIADEERDRWVRLINPSRRDRAEERTIETVQSGPETIIRASDSFSLPRDPDLWPDFISARQRHLAEFLEKARALLNANWTQQNAQPLEPLPISGRYWPSDASVPKPDWW